MISDSGGGLFISGAPTPPQVWEEYVNRGDFSRSIVPGTTADDIVYKDGQREPRSGPVSTATDSRGRTAYRGGLTTSAADELCTAIDEAAGGHARQGQADLCCEEVHYARR